MARHSTNVLTIGIAFVASLICADRLSAQTQQPAAMLEHLRPFTAEERLAVERTTLADQRVLAIVGAGQPRVTTTNVELDKTEAEAYIAGQTTTPPTRRVTVVLFNAATNKAARAIVAPSQNRVLAVQSIRASDVPFVRDDADQALALAKADPAVRRAVGDNLGKFEILESGNETPTPFAAQAHPLRSSDPRDTCSVDRCLDLLFRTEAGYLPFQAHVDLTKRTVTVQGGGQH